MFPSNSSPELRVPTLAKTFVAGYGELSKRGLGRGASQYRNENDTVVCLNNVLSIKHFY